MRLHRRLRRLPRRLPPVDPGRRADRARVRLSVQLARHPRPGGAGDGRADLRVARARLRALLDALADGQPAVPAGARRRGRSTRWPDERIWDELQVRLGARVGVNRGPDLREGHHADALVRLRADAARAAVPGRRRGAHRPADRRQGAQPRGQRRAAARRGAARLLRGRHHGGARRVLRHGAAAGLARAGLLELHDAAAARPRRRAFEQRLQLARLDYLARSEAAARSLAENYVGLPASADF